MNLEKYHELAAYLKHLADIQKSEGRDYSIVDHKLLVTTSAAIEQLLMEIKDCMEGKEQ
ncbi:hypothetical protein RZD54_005529 [Citrobacter freundii]|uniref:Uncharacterized protein n=1 Tax=Citrobacter freundii TaxID=546 RepID=A0AAN4D060_CITFR|nr:hypothetical protein [Citrobacter freundii]EKV4647089.1 hypothetical protein [Citrobacter freundii]EKW7208865.1 hypothetical protein [Citrobacter freundii]ELO0990058.1 hypothetical protein [Citrobacter freundii]ELV3679395.1 hypothetical protein [Citrobacter freundii]ELZ9654114.1 hypothetical protein [Citrobacter freundii]